MWQDTHLFAVNISQEEMAWQESIQIQYLTKWDTLLFETFPVMRL